MGQAVRKNQESFVIAEEYADAEREYGAKHGKGTILDLLLPIFVLIVACIFGMLYTGGIYEGKTVAEAFADCDSSKSLVLGSFIAFVFLALLYLPRKIVSFKAFCECFGLGFKAMVPAIFILCLAWTMSGIVSDKYLNLGGYVGNLVNANASLGLFLPAIFFLVAAFLGFATGTEWPSVSCFWRGFVPSFGYECRRGERTKLNTAGKDTGHDSFWNCDLFIFGGACGNFSFLL